MQQKEKIEKLKEELNQYIESMNDYRLRLVLSFVKTLVDF